ncbi:hypothetical protein FACS1894137_11180 [Spirochaetia bacterium]|nr:hypothetical protein FACS1894137_11180 [Spirochaetia bacterium]
MIIGNFDEAISISMRKPVLIEFRAEWCRSCKGFSDIIRGLNRDHPDLVICMVDVEDHPDIADRYGIVSLPTVILLSAGDPVIKESGALPRQRIEAIMRGVI